MEMSPFMVKELGRARTINLKLAVLLMKIMKYWIVQFLLYKYLEESPNCLYYVYCVYSWFSWKLAFSHTYHCHYFCCPTPWSKKIWYTKNYLKTHRTFVVTKIGSEKYVIITDMESAGIHFHFLVLLNHFHF